LFLNSIFIDLILPDLNCGMRSELNGMLWWHSAAIFRRQKTT